MNKRLISLIAALLAVIMLIPSVALAEAPTLTITGTVAAIDLHGSQLNSSYVPEGLTATAHPSARL